MAIGAVLVVTDGPVEGCSVHRTFIHVYGTCINFFFFLFLLFQVFYEVIISFLQKLHAKKICFTDMFFFSSILKCTMRQCASLISDENMNILDFFEKRVCAKKVEEMQHHEFAFINHFIGLTVRILMWNDLFPRQQSLRSNAGTHIDSWWSALHQRKSLGCFRHEIAIPFLIVTPIAPSSAVFTPVPFFLLLSNIDCPFSIKCPIAEGLYRPLNVLLCCPTRLMEEGESFETPETFIGLFLFILICISPEQSARVCLMIVLCPFHKWTALPLCPHPTQSWLSSLDCLPLIGPFDCPKGH